MKLVEYIETLQKIYAEVGDVDVWTCYYGRRTKAEKPEISYTKRSKQERAPTFWSSLDSESQKGEIGVRV